MNLSINRTRTATLLAAATLLSGPTAIGQTTFSGSYGYEDGTGTIFGVFPSETVSAANVSGGSEIDYGPSSAPFPEPVTYTVTPASGTRLLEVTELDTTLDAGAPNVVLATVENLLAGDSVSFGFMAFDPSDGRSPSILPSAVYITADGPNSFAGGVFVGEDGQEFAAGTGYLDIQFDGDSETSGLQPILFDAGTQGDRTGLALRATLIAPSLSANPDDGDYKFFLDDVQVTVTTSSPDAQIVFADGSVIAVPEPATAGLLALGGLALLRRRRA